MDTSISAVELDVLLQGLPGVSPVRAQAHLEACMVCLDDQQHHSGVEMQVDGDIDTKLKIIWNGDVTEQIILSWKDEQEATEEGACGLAFLLVLRLTDYTVIERSRKESGFDYWLGYGDDLPFQRSARLEVSGIRHDNNQKELKARVRKKIKQVEKYPNPLPAYIVVVDFGEPRSRMVLRS